MDPDLRALLQAAYPAGWLNHRLPGVLELRFNTETAVERNRQIRFWIIASLVFSLLTAPLDAMSVPDVWRLGLLLRLCAVLPVSLIAIWLLSASRTRWLEMLASVAPPAVALLTVLMTFAAASTADTFRSAVVLPFGILWMNALIPMRLRDTLVFTLATLSIGDTINIVAASLHHVGFDHTDVLIASHMTVGLSVLFRFVAERESRRSFMLGLKMQIRAEDLARSNVKLLEMSHTDPLTGLANRRFFDVALVQAWEAAVIAQSAVSMMMIDVDHFKQFNDAAGHLEGDRCLTMVARAIAEQVRGDRDLAARFGGEEFVVLMPGVDGDSAYQAGERVSTAIAALRLSHPGLIDRGFVTVSVGVAAMRPGTQAGTPAAIIAAADRALYDAKAAGRNRVVIAGSPVRQVSVQGSVAVAQT